MNFRSTPRKSIPEIDLTPLINIVFLILIFFMLAGTISQSDAIQTARMQSELALDEDEVLIILVDQNASMKVLGQSVSKDQLRDKLAAQYATGGTVAIKPDARLAAEELLAVSTLMRESGFAQMTLIVDSP